MDYVSESLPVDEGHCGVELRESLCGRSSGFAWVTRRPSRNCLSLPDPTDSELGFRFRKIAISPNQLVYPLPGHSKDLGDFGHAHEILRHQGNLANT